MGANNKVELRTPFVLSAGIDTTRLRFHFALSERALAEVLQDREVRPTEGQPYIEGHLDNLRVRATPEHLTLQGSFATFGYGHNAFLLGPAEFERMGEEISDRLFIPAKEMRKAMVKRLDIAMTAAMSRPVSEYLRTLGDRSRSRRRNHREETVAYDVRNRTQHYYDKVLEMREKQQAWQLPDWLRGAYLLRYEVQYKRRVARQFGCPVTMGDLCDPAFHRELKAKMLRLHEEVPKRRVLRLDEPLGTPRLVQRLAVAGVEAVGGVGELNSAIAEDRAAGLLTQKQSYRLRQKVRELETDEALTLQDAAAAELDAVIRLATS